MRTTLTLDDDVAYRLRELNRVTGGSFKRLVNETLRAGLQASQQPAVPVPPFRVTPKKGGFRSGIDVRRLNQLSDELENEELLDEVARSSSKR